MRGADREAVEQVSDAHHRPGERAPDAGHPRAPISVDGSGVGRTGLGGAHGHESVRRTISRDRSTHEAKLCLIRRPALPLGSERAHPPPIRGEMNGPNRATFRGVTIASRQTEQSEPSTPHRFEPEGPTLTRETSRTQLVDAVFHVKHPLLELFTFPEPHAYGRTPRGVPEVSTRARTAFPSPDQPLSRIPTRSPVPAPPAFLTTRSYTRGSGDEGECRTPRVD